MSRRGAFGRPFHPPAGSRRCGPPGRRGISPAQRRRSDSQEHRAPASSSSRVPSLHASVTACRVDGLTIIGQARGTRGIGRVHGPFARGRDTQNPEIAKPAWKAGLHPGEAGENLMWQSRVSPTSPIFASPYSCHGRSVPRVSRFRAGCAATRRLLCSHSSLSPLTSTAPEAASQVGDAMPRQLRRPCWAMLSVIRTLPTTPASRRVPPDAIWPQLEAEAGFSPVTPPSRRRLCLPDRTAIPAALGEGAGVPARDRQREARQARCAERAVRGVPEPRTKEKPDKKNQGGARARARFARSGR